MNPVPTEHGLILAAVLFALGLFALLARRNLIMMLIGVEIMLNSAGLAFVVAGAKWSDVEGQIMFIFILTMAAAEVAIGLGLILQFFWRHQSLDADLASRMKG